MEPPKEELAYEVTPHVSERDFLQIFYDLPIQSTSRRQVDPKQLIEFVDKLLKTKSPFTERVQRAIRWYHLGVMQTDVLDQFNCFWIGLDALNPILQQKLEVGNEIQRCKKCGHEFSVTTISGIRALIEK
ncbi:MAG: hypothetical protein GX811_07725 [Lentisphaerae bacterium]|nr:hypothetical protein [Lentisphaerota bacterium]